MKIPIKVWLKRNWGTDSEKMTKVLSIIEMSPDITMDKMYLHINDLPLKTVLKAYQTIKQK